MDITPSLEKHLRFEYTSFDRVIFRGYIQNLFATGSVIKLLRNLGFNNYTNGVMRILTDKLNSHIQKQAKNLGIYIHWWGEKEKKQYNSKIDFIQSVYKKELADKRKKSKVIAIIKAVENTRTFTTKAVKKKDNSWYKKMFSVNKFVSQYYIYIDDVELGLCYLKISSYLPFVCEFYFNGHNVLKKKFDNLNVNYRMKDNSFTFVDNTELLNSLIKNFKPSIVLNRINHWMNIFFRFDQGKRSTISKLLKHNWFTYQTEISTNLIFKSAKFANNFFDNILSKNHTIGLPDKLTNIFSLSRQKTNSKSTQNRFTSKAVIKHWLEKNSIKCYNKSGCLLRIETTINKPDLPGLKLKKPAINIMAYYWYGFGSNSRYIKTISDVNFSLFSHEEFDKLRTTITNEKGVKIPAFDLRKDEQVLFLEALLLTSNFSFGFRNKDLKKILGKNWKTAKIAYQLRKLRERNLVERLQASHYYRLTQKGYIWIFSSYFNIEKLVKPLFSGSYNNSNFSFSNQHDIIKHAFIQIKNTLTMIMPDFKLVS